jgi:hypothetical protein
MNVKPLILILVVVLLIAGVIYLIRERSITGTVVYGKCWEAKKLSPEGIATLHHLGCTVENNICALDQKFCSHPDTYARVCCPSQECPDLPEMYPDSSC